MFAVGRRAIVRLTLTFVAGWTTYTLATDERAAVDDPQRADRFSGRVTGPDGEAVGGARVYLTRVTDKPAGAPKLRTTSGADGRFEFDAPDMTFIDHDGLPSRRAGFLAAVAEAYGPDFLYTRGWSDERPRSARDRAPRAAFELRLAKDDVPIRGRLLAPDGNPLVGAQVRLANLLVPPDYDLDAHLAKERQRDIFSCSPGYERSLAGRPHLLPEAPEAVTDADGRFRMSGLGRERLVVLRITAPAIVDTSLTVVTRDTSDMQVRMGRRNSPLAQPPSFIFGADFKLLTQKGRTLSGVVIDRDTRQPIAGMVVGTGRAGYPRDGAWGHTTVTDEAGRFTITGLTPANDKDKPWPAALTAMSPPGMTYQSAEGAVNGDEPITIECERGIPFRLTLVDESGEPAEAEVKYFEVLPNPHAPKNYCFPCYKPLSVPARRPDGTYRGFVVPGPGALLVKTPDRPDYAAASVDPRKFFAANLLELPLKDWEDAYGTTEGVRTVGGRFDPNEYAAIVLVNPEVDSPPLELSAVVSRRPSRMVTLVDSQGEPVVGARTRGMTRAAYDYEPPLRVATFPLYRLHPKRSRRIVFLHDERRLGGVLEAQADGAARYTVRMEPWGTVVGRLVDAEGKPLKASISVRMFTQAGAELPAAPIGGKVEADGRFRTEQLVPGARYTARAYGGGAKALGVVFENLKVAPGEVRDLGDVRVAPPAVAVERSLSVRAWELVGDGQTLGERALCVTPLG